MASSVLTNATGLDLQNTYACRHFVVTCLREGLSEAHDCVERVCVAVLSCVCGLGSLSGGDLCVGNCWAHGCSRQGDSVPGKLTLEPG
jgi:hypothetical protein